MLLFLYNNKILTLLWVLSCESSAMLSNMCTQCSTISSALCASMSSSTVYCNNSDTALIVLIISLGLIVKDIILNVLFCLFYAIKKRMVSHPLYISYIHVDYSQKSHSNLSSIPVTCFLINTCLLCATNSLFTLLVFHGSILMRYLFPTVSTIPLPINILNGFA